MGSQAPSANPISPQTPGPTQSPSLANPSPARSVATLATSRKRGGSPRARLWLALSAGVVALLCLGSFGVIVALYDNATKVKRSDPSVVMVNFLSAYMTHRNDQDAALYICKDKSDLGELSLFRREIEAAEKKYSIEVVVTWRNLNVQISGDHAAATVDIVRTVSDGSERTSAPWKFDLLNDGDWRVCSASPNS
ncbi:Rv0361 family membrane protein [Actinoplanes regularis]|uniref:Rv0361 family membrane protein n=1 Tax=Actinoplanes regularis TaxID=52697 RepID=UPI001A5AAC84|nr:hypothetical protein Are01nite_39350 [Actinoplanes regularis]